MDHESYGISARLYADHANTDRHDCWRVGSLADGPYVADFSNRPDRRVTYAYIVSSGLFGWLVASHAASRPVKIPYSPRLRSLGHHAAEM